MPLESIVGAIARDPSYSQYLVAHPKPATLPSEEQAPQPAEQDEEAGEGAITSIVC